MAVFDPRVIQKFANRLHRRALVTMMASTALGALSGGVLGLVFCLNAIGFSSGQGDSAALGNLAVGLLGGFLGVVILGLGGFLAGRERAFRLKLQAQIALCQLKIEESTRRGLM